MANVVLNNELKGVEIYFGEKPQQNIIDGLKSNGFRYHGGKVCWYAKQNEKTLKEASKYSEETVGTETQEETTTKLEKNVIAKPISINNLPLWDRLQFKEGTANTNKKRFKFTGSNYTGLSTKETASEVRKHLKDILPEVKFSITSDYNHISITIKQSPYNHSVCEYSPNREPREYREFEAEHNRELIAIKDYCSKLLDSYNYDDSDSQSDYFNTHFYDSVSIDDKYIQIDQTEEVKADIIDFKNKLQQAEEAEEIRKEQERQEWREKQAEETKLHQIREAEEKKEVELIYNSINVLPLEESNQYFVIGSQFANLNKNDTLDSYKEEVKNGKFYLQNVKITKEVHFNSEDALNLFSNMLLNDFDFLSETGGSYTDDVRIQTMTDYHNMTKEEQETVIFNLYGVAIYYNNQLQFVVDTQGYNYARYVGLVEGVTITKEDNVKQFINPEQLQILKDKAETLTDYSVEVITNNNLVGTWNNENWTQYKELMKAKIKDSNFKLLKSVIQQLTEDEEVLKVAMYKLLIEVDGIQEQFKDADLQQGQKLTLFDISDFGSIITRRMTLDSVEYTKYAQYDNAVKLTFKPQGKRNLHYNYWYSTLLVYDGWLDLPEDVLHIVETKGDFRITKSKYLSCDKKQFDEILSHFEGQGIKPLINTYKPTF